MIEVHLDTWIYVPQKTTTLRVGLDNGRLKIYVTDHCDIVQGYFRSKEDIEKVRDELNKYLKDIKNASKRID
jgi:hypothetical protein